MEEVLSKRIVNFVVKSFYLPAERKERDYIVVKFVHTKVGQFQEINVLYAENLLQELEESFVLIHAIKYIEFKKIHNSLPDGIRRLNSQKRTKGGKTQ